MKTVIYFIGAGLLLFGLLFVGGNLPIGGSENIKRTVTTRRASPFVPAEYLNHDGCQSCKWY